MTVNSRRRSRFTQDHGSNTDVNTPDKAKPQQERRRTFAFMKSSPSASPNRRKVSSATLEKTRAHAKKLARLAASKQQQHQQEQNDDHHIQYNVDPYDFEMNNNDGFNSYNFQSNLSPQTKPSLNFAAFETESCISSSVYDMDYIDQMPSFDESVSATSYLSSASNVSALTSNSMMRNSNTYHHPSSGMKGKNKNKLGMYNGVGSLRNLQLQQQIIAEYEASPYFNKSPYHSPPLHHHQEHHFDSNASTASGASSTVSGAAARRLMRRGVASPMTDANISNHSVFETPPKQEQLPPLSPVPSYSKSISSPPSSSLSSKKKKKKSRKVIESTGFSFDAFGLDAKEIDNEVNAAMKELEDSNLDLSFFTTASEECSMSSNGSRSQSQHQQLQHQYNHSSSRTIASDNTSLAAMHTQYDMKNVVTLSGEYIDKKKQSNHEAFNRGFMIESMDNFFDHKGENNNDSDFMAEASWTADFGENDVHENSEQIPMDQTKLNEKKKNDESSSGNESDEKPPQFQPRKATNFEAKSESQKRAKEWASERIAPILVSPLLVPKKNALNKETVSHKRAKEWATEAPSPRHVNERTSGAHNVQKQQQEQQQKQQQHNQQASPQFIPSRQRQPVQVDVQRKQENVILRNTEVRNINYDKFKSTAPVVSLRKVVVPSRSTKNSSTNSTFFDDSVEETLHHDDYVRDSDENNVLEKYNEELYVDETGDLPRIPSPRKPKLTYREKREKELQEQQAKIASKVSNEQKGFDVEASIRRRIAANRQNLANGNEISAKSDDLNNNIDIPSLKNKLRPVSQRHPEVSHNQVQIDSLRNQLRPIESRQSANSVTEKKDKHLDNDPSFDEETGSIDVKQFVKHEERPYIKNTSSPVDTRSNHVIAKLSEDKKIIEEKPSLNNISNLFAQRSGMMNNNLNDKPNQKVFEDTSNDNHEEEPSIKNVAELFQKRASLLSNPPHKNKGNKEESLDSSIRDKSNLASMLAKRSEGLKSEQSKMIAVGEIETNDIEAKADLNLALKDNPVYSKYFKMLKMGLPMEAVKHAMTRDGLDSNILDSESNQTTPDGVPLKEDPKYAKYFKMLKMGLPMGAVKNAMERDGENPSVMDNDHSLPASTGSKGKSPKSYEPPPKDKYRRTRLHWDTLRMVRATSVWALVNQDPDVEQIEIDEHEFEKLFKAEMGASAITEGDSSKKKNVVKVIDPKRANNGGIVLARLKVTYEEMALAIDRIDETAMTLEQTQGIVEYIPNKEEKIALRKYMTSSGKDSADAFDELCECEKFMVAMMTVKHSKEKVRAILFKLQFKQCVEELGQDVRLIERSCDELRNSVRLRKLLGIVLNIGNRLNTAGPTRKGKAGAFTIESLLKLSQAKAFDKKTTFLHYIVMVVKRNNEFLARFKDDIPSVLKSDKIYWDQCENDLEEVENQLENVRKIALHQVYGKNRPPWARQKKGKDDDEMSQESMSLEAEVQALRSTKIGLFTLQAIETVSNLRENVESTKRKFIKLLEYFGEEEKKKIQPHELFEIIVTFVKDFDRAQEQVAKLEEKKKTSEKKKTQGTRNRSLSNNSRDSSRDDNSHHSSTPTRPTRSTKPIRSNPKHENSSSNHPPRALSLQTHVASPIISSKRQQPTVTAKAHHEQPAMEKRPSPVIDHSIVKTKQSSPASQISDDSISRETGDNSEGKNLTSRTTTTTECTSDSESHSFPIDTGASVDSKEHFDENTLPHFSTSTPGHNNISHEQISVRKEIHKMDDYIDGNNQISKPTGVNTKSNTGFNSHQFNQSSVEYNEKVIKTDNVSRPSTDSGLSLREKARAMRHQRILAQRSPPRNIQKSPTSPTYPQVKSVHPQSYTSSPTYSPYDNQKMQFADFGSVRSKTRTPSSSEKPNSSSPPSPKDIKPKSSPASPGGKTAHTSTLSISQERIRARRERIERRRKMMISS